MESEEFKELEQKINELEKDLKKLAEFAGDNLVKHVQRIKSLEERVKILEQKL